MVESKVKKEPGTHHKSLPDPRIEQILNALLKIAGKDFDINLKVSEHRDEIDAIMLSVNMLGEEMHSYTNQLEASREQVVQSAKLASLGEMASGLSHELNNPLFILTGFMAQALKVLVKKHPEAYLAIQEHAQEVQNAADRIRKIIDHMRDFSRVARNELEVLDVNVIIKSAFSFFNQQLLLKNIETQFDLSESPVLVQVDKIKLEQVFVNLLSNAKDAIEKKSSNQGGRIKIITLHEGDHARILLKDDGCGMDSATKSKIFDAFFTTKEVGKGTGLGLSVSYGILRSFGAEIDCESAPMEGTQFSIRIPTVQELE